MVIVREFLCFAIFALWLIEAELSPIQKRSLSRNWDEGNNNGGLPGANDDEEWLGGGGSPGKRRVAGRYWDEGSSNGGLPGAGGDETWLGGGSSPGKRWATTELKARYWDEGNNNGGLPGAGDDEEWLGSGTSPGKRRIAGIKARYWDEGNVNGGVPGAGDDEEWLGGGSSPGKRNLDFDDKKRWPTGGVVRYYDDGNTSYFPIQVHSEEKQGAGTGEIVPAQDTVKEQAGVFKSLGDFFHRVHLASNPSGK